MTLDTCPRKHARASVLILQVPLNFSQYEEDTVSCTIITTKPNDVVAADIHDRMAVILRHEVEGICLDRDKFDSDLLQSLLVAYDSDMMRAYPVSTMVGSPKNDMPECIEEITNL
ncbi:SOS response-associated peptidase family protein [Bacillus thuringiensis]|nr:SOS response-associated peptidase family protein [Bacillus thuringiensis]